jgi:hypothetical protein
VVLASPVERVAKFQGWPPPLIMERRDFLYPEDRFHGTVILHYLPDGFDLHTLNDGTRVAERAPGELGAGGGAAEGRQGRRRRQRGRRKTRGSSMASRLPASVDTSAKMVTRSSFDIATA